MSNTDTPERSDPVCEVEFTCRGAEYPFVRASEAENCRIELADMFPRPDGYAEFFGVVGADPVRIAAQADGYDSVDVTILSEYEGGGFLEFRVSGDCPAFRLAELGALPREVRGDEGRGRIVAEIPARNETSEIVDAFLADYPDFELASKRERETVAPRFSRSAFQEVVHDHLTDRQREVLQTAFEAGYYDWPRQCTGEEVATELDIASPTFAEHIKAAERKLISLLFTDSPPSSPR